MNKFSGMLCVCLLLSACESVTIRTDNLRETSDIPSYQKSFNYWWWGLKGEHDINVREICTGNSVTQLQSIASFSDAAFTMFTLGIYSPRSARIWCKGDQDV